MFDVLDKQSKCDWVSKGIKRLITELNLIISACYVEKFNNHDKV